MIHQGQGVPRHDRRRVVGFVRRHGAAADAAVVEAADLDSAIAGLFPLRRACGGDAGLLVRPRGLVVGGLQRPGQPLYLRAPRVVRPRQSDDEEHLGGAAAVPAVEEPDALRLVAVLVPVHLAVRHCCSLASDSSSSSSSPGLS
uniref:Uncharacterized protein n=1 Tax=Arundo donax TaxID=35708 RepID=A0A0A9DPI3_ARUDO